MLELLLLSFATILAGPLFYLLIDKRGFAHHFLDTFIIFSVFGLALFHVIPESVEIAGTWAVAAACIGFLGPIVFSSLFSDGECHMHKSLISMATLGLFAHSILDGLTLVSATKSQGMVLALAVVLHRLPEGVGIWRFVTPRLGAYFSLALIGVDLLGTTLGFFFGNQIIAQTSETALISFQALMAGTLLHVMFHRHHIEANGEHVHSHSPRALSNRLGKGFGALAGALLVVSLWAIHPPHNHEHSTQHHAQAGK